MTDYTLARDYWYAGSRDTFLVPAGTKTDLASIPWPFSLWLPPGGPWALAAILHDHLYRTKPWVTYTVGSEGVFRQPQLREARKMNDYLLESRLSRKDADGIMKRHMRELGVSWLKRNIIYLGVRLGGWRAW